MTNSAELSETASRYSGLTSAVRFGEEVPCQRREGATCFHESCQRYEAKKRLVDAAEAGKDKGWMTLTPASRKTDDGYEAFWDLPKPQGRCTCGRCQECSFRM